MSGHNRKRSKKAAPVEEHGDGERWLVSYADMLTVLVGLFIVLYAMSQVDQAKYEQLAASLAEGFGGSSQAVMNTGSSILENNTAIVPKISPDVNEELATALRNDNTGAQDSLATSVDKKDYEAAVQEYQDLQALAERLETHLAEKGVDGTVKYRIDERGLVIGLVSDELFFVADTARLTDTSRKVIDTLAPALRKLPNQIAIEGHANTVPSTAYASNWELSADRAVQVLRRFASNGKIDPQRLAATGFGDARPLKSNKTEEGLVANRRVDIVVLSSQPERIRELIPQVMEDLSSQASHG
ncbi:flagellar motor protein MotB [Timonella sp. A28]|uniref:flagellar motor protein MotB n=1 Tax=Timonella sp. A28 TaxID=3442640 RepID=UPI003EB81E19